MKNIKLYLGKLLVLLTFTIIINSITFAQHKIYGKEIKSITWKGKSVECVDGEIAIKLKKGYNASQLSGVLNKHSYKIKQNFDELGWGWIEIPEGTDIMPIIENLRNLDFIECVEPNFVIKTSYEPNDPYYMGTNPAAYPHQWALKNTGQTPPGGLNDGDIDAPEAWDISMGSSNVIVAVLDTGIPMLNGALSHPDLDDPDKIILGPDFIDNPNDPYADLSIKDYNGHGTHVAGIIGAETNNNTGIAGVCPNCKILVIQVFNKYGNSTPLSFYNGVKYAVDNYNSPTTPLIIYYSGAGAASGPLFDAVLYSKNRNVSIVAPVGNSSGSEILYPAAYSSSEWNVIAVSSTDHNDIFSRFSSRGTQVNVSAYGGYGTYEVGNTIHFNGPQNLGRNILSTTPNYPFTIQYDPKYPNDPFISDITPDYGYLNGTSMAAAYVAGVAALILSASPDRNNSLLRGIIEASSEDRGVPGWDFEYGYGRVNAYKALRFVFTVYGGQVKSTVLNNWNMTSVPLTLLNYSKPVVYPTSTSPAWQLTPSGYISADPLSNGVGYWIRFGAAQDITYNHLGIFSIDMPVHTGWNIIGSITQLVFTHQVKPINTNITSSFFEYEGGYIVSEKIKPGKGYWVKVDQPGTLRINVPLPENPPTGVPPDPPYLISPGNWSAVETPVTLSWSSSIGATSYNLSITKFSGPTYEYTNINSTSFTVKLALGTYKWSVSAVNFYGVTSCGCTGYFTVGQLPDYAENNLESFELLDQITVIDASGSQQSLFLTNEGRILGSELLMSVEMPPEPPAGVPSIRFESGKYIEKLPSDQKAKKIPIKIRDCKLPLTIKWNLKKENYASYWITRLGQGDRINMLGTGSVVLNNIKDGIINLEGIASQPTLPIGNNEIVKNESPIMPVTYALAQNYPNPFNPLTIINYQLPIDNWVTLKVYDILGREVATVVNEFKEAGYYAATWDATNVPSGVYFYKLTASLYTSVKKMLLVR